MTEVQRSDEERPRVLIVEDDLLIALEMEKTLTEAGFEVQGHAVDLRTLLRAIGDETPDVALVDVGLKDGADGY